MAKLSIVSAVPALRCHPHSLNADLRWHTSTNITYVAIPHSDGRARRRTTHNESIERVVRIMSRLLTIAAAVAAGIAFTAPAVACPLNLTGGKFCYSVSVTSGNIGLSGPYPTFSGLGNTPQAVGIPKSIEGGGASAVADSANNGTLKVSAAVDNYGESSFADASLSYVFRMSSIPGMGVDALVPMHISALAESLRDSTFGVEEYASFVLQQDGSNLIYKFSNTLHNRDITMFAIDQWINVKPDHDILLELNASATAIGSRTYSRQVSGVHVDPVFTIAPEFASRYTLTGLPLGASPTAVPEPASWALMIAGLGLTGVAMRRRRRRAAKA